MRKYIGIILLFILVFVGCKANKGEQSYKKRTIHGVVYDHISGDGLNGAFITNSANELTIITDSIEFVYFNNEWIPGAEINMVCADSITKIEIRNDEYGNRCAFVTMSSASIDTLKTEVEKATFGWFLHYDPVCEFPGGMIHMMKWLKENIRIPEWYKGKERVVVTFMIQPDGTVYDGKIIRGSKNEELNSEALRLVESLPKFDVRYYTPKKEPQHMAWPILFEGKDSLP